jgi:hypothetical protein
MSTVIEPNADGGQPPAGAQQQQQPASVADAPKAIVEIEGAKIPLLEKWAANDEMLKKALRKRYSMINNATITRKRDGNGVLIVTVVKRADFKGRGGRKTPPARLTPHARVIAALRAAEPHTNPALALARELQLRSARGRLGPLAVARLKPRIDAAVKEGERELELTKKVIGRLKQCRPSPSSEAPSGF